MTEEEVSLSKSTPNYRFDVQAPAAAAATAPIEVDPAPDKVVQLLNSTLFRTGDRRAFMTLFYALLEPETGRLRYVCAGHPFPLLRRRDGSAIELGSGAVAMRIEGGAHHGGRQRMLTLMFHRSSQPQQIAFPGVTQ